MNHFHSGSGEYCVEPGGELRVAIAEQEPQLVGSLVEFHEQVTGLLGDPDTGGVRRGAGDVDLAGGQFQEDQHVDPLKKTVSTVNNSQATMPRACAVRDKAASTTRSPGSRAGRCTWRRSTPTTLVSQDQQFDVLRAAVPGELGQHLQDLT